MSGWRATRPDLILVHSWPADRRTRSCRRPSASERLQSRASICRTKQTPASELMKIRESNQTHWSVLFTRDDERTWTRDKTPWPPHEWSAELLWWPTGSRPDLVCESPDRRPAETPEEEQRGSLVSSAHQSCVYLIKNTGKIHQYFYNLKQLFSMWICVKL